MSNRPKLGSSPLRLVRPAGAAPIILDAHGNAAREVLKQLAVPAAVAGPEPNQKCPRCEKGFHSPELQKALDAPAEDKACDAQIVTMCPHCRGIHSIEAVTRKARWRGRCQAPFARVKRGKTRIEKCGAKTCGNQVYALPFKVEPRAGWCPLCVVVQHLKDKYREQLPALYAKLKGAKPNP